MLPLERSASRLTARTEALHGHSAMPKARRTRHGTRPFSLFEWMLAGRYLRTRRREGLRLGHRRLLVPRHHAGRRDADRRAVGDERIPQGTARQDRRHQRPHLRCADRQPADRLSPRWPARIAAVPGVKRAIPLVEGQAFGSSQYNGSGVLVRGVRAEDLQQDRVISRATSGRARWRISTTARGVAIGRRLAESLSLQAGDTITLITPRGASTPFGTAPRIKGYPVMAVFEIGMSEFDFDLRLHAARRGAGLFQPRRRRDRHRDLSRQRRPRRRGARRRSRRRRTGRSS